MIKPLIAVDSLCLHLEIIRYNQLLFNITKKYKHVHHVEVHNDFIDKLEYYLEATHINKSGNEVLSQKNTISISPK